MTCRTLALAFALAACTSFPTPDPLPAPPDVRFDVFNDTTITSVPPDAPPPRISAAAAEAVARRSADARAPLVALIRRFVTTPVNPGPVMWRGTAWIVAYHGRVAGCDETNPAGPCDVLDILIIDDQTGDMRSNFGEGHVVAP